jgi:hypothetical protein
MNWLQFKTRQHLWKDALPAHFYNTKLFTKIVGTKVDFWCFYAIDIRHNAVVSSNLGRQGYISAFQIEYNIKMCLMFRKKT